MNGQLIALMLLPPAFAAVVCAASLFFGDKLLNWRKVQTLTLFATGAALLGAVLMALHFVVDPQETTVTVMRWFEFSGAQINLAFRIDLLSIVMALVVAGFGFVIAWFSINYMHNERGFTRYFATYALFVTMMLVLVLADNLVLMFLGWEGVGLCSYLLIGHYNHRPAAASAATEAFIANRIGDAGLILGIVILLSTVGTVQFDRLEGALAGAAPWVAPAVAVCLLIAAVGKSAQLPLGGWLAKAMEGPTPSSALIHAATMVTAGVYLIVRANPIFEGAPVVMMSAAIIGAATALTGALAGQTGSDIKGILASSTTMHLGIMFVLCGLGFYTLAIFYIVAHAFYKSYKFLTAPSILHHLHGHLDLGSEASTAPLSSCLIVALLVALGLLLGPPLLSLLGVSLPTGVALPMLVGIVIAGVAQIVCLVRTASHHEEHEGHHHQHSHEPHGEVESAVAEDSQTKVRRSLNVTIVLIAAAVGLSIFQFEPGLSVNLQPDVLRMEPILAFIFAAALGLLVVHATLSVMLLNRDTPERSLAALPSLQTFYLAAANRFWIDAIIYERIVPAVLALSRRLSLIDSMFSRGVMQATKVMANSVGDFVGWIDNVPRRAAESLPSLLGTHIGEVAQSFEKATTSGFEDGIGRVMRTLGRSARTAESALSRPIFSVVVVVIVTLVALAGV